MVNAECISLLAQENTRALTINFNGENINKASCKVTKQETVYQYGNVIQRNINQPYKNILQKLIFAVGQIVSCVLR